MSLFLRLISPQSRAASRSSRDMAHLPDVALARARRHRQPYSTTGTTLERKSRGRKFTCCGQRPSRPIVLRLPTVASRSRCRLCAWMPADTRVPAGDRVELAPCPRRAASVGPVQLPPVAGDRNGRMPPMMAGLYGARRAGYDPFGPKGTNLNLILDPVSGTASYKRTYSKSSHRLRRHMSRCRLRLNGASYPGSKNGGSRWTRCRVPLFANG